MAASVSCSTSFAIPSPVLALTCKNPNGIKSTRSDFVNTYIFSTFCGISGNTCASAPATAITKSAFAPRSLARRTPSASTTSSVARNPAVSVICTGTPPKSTRTPIASRVVPGISETIATSSPANAFSKVDLPAFGLPKITNSKPSRSRSARGEASSTARISSCSRLIFPSSLASTSGGKSSSGKSISASCCAIISRSASRQAAHAACSTSAPSTASRRCASVSAATRSAIASACSKSIRPFKNARRENSPASAGLAPAATSAALTAASTARPPCSASSTQSSPV